MKMRLSTKVGVILTAIAAVGFLASAISIFYTWAMRRDVDLVVTESAAEMMAAVELDIALLKQRGHVASFILDEGNDKWLDDLKTQEPAFRAALELVTKMTDETGDHAELASVGRAFDKYDAARDRVLELYRKGDHAAAKRHYVTELNRSYREASALCDDVLADRRRDIEKALVHYRQVAGRLSLFMITSILLTGLLGGGLVWLLFSGVFGPLRRMAEEARGFSANAGPEDRTRPLDDLDGLSYYLRALMAEVSDARRDAERSRAGQEESSRLAAIGKTVAHISHELRNRVMVLGGFAGLIERRADDAAAVAQNARIVCEQSKRLEHLLGDIMDFSRPVEMEAVTCSLNSLVEETIHNLMGRFGSGVEIKVVLDPAVPEVTVDPLRIEQVILNLVRNAAEAVAPRGTVTARTGRQGETAVLVVEDTGPGVPKEVQARLFEPFFTTKKKGTGLGLAICSQIVAKHGGVIRCESSPGKGATFTVALPPARMKR